LHEELAFHAQRCGLASSFIRFALSAAEGYRAAQALGPAIRLLEDVLASLDVSAGSPEPPGLTRDALRSRLNRELAEMHRQRGNASRALETYTVLLSLEEKG